MEWQHWSDCTQSCSKNGTAGTRARNRGFIPGRYGDMEGKSPKLGSKHQEEECNEDVECPGKNKIFKIFLSIFRVHYFIK